MRALRKLAAVAIGLLALAVTGVLAYGVPHHAQPIQIVTKTSAPAAPDLPPPGVLVGNACSVSQIQADLNVLDAAMRLFGHPATGYEAELFGRALYGCNSFTT